MSLTTFLDNGKAPLKGTCNELRYVCSCLVLSVLPVSATAHDAVAPGRIGVHDGRCPLGLQQVDQYGSTVSLKHVGYQAPAKQGQHTEGSPFS